LANKPSDRPQAYKQRDNAGLRPEEIVKASAVFLPNLVIALLLITYFAPLSTWLPGVLFAD
jgi:TRAP-type C4-dicarboxylate transport system permease large subunit